MKKDNQITLTYRLYGEKEVITMKKVIRGRAYDTETACRIGAKYGNTYDRSNFEFWEEELFRKKTGEYFLYYQGGPLSKYATHQGTNSGWGEGIKPMTYEIAQEWAETNLDAEDYLKEFGTPEEDYTKISCCLTLQKRLYDKVKRYAAQQEKTVGQIIEELIDKLDG